MSTLKPAIDIKELKRMTEILSPHIVEKQDDKWDVIPNIMLFNQQYYRPVPIRIPTRAERIYHRYIKAKGGIPYALRFKAWCKRYGIEL